MNAAAHTPIRVYLVEDHVAVRQGVTLLLAQEGITICGETHRVSTAAQEIVSKSPTVVIVDLSLENEDGIDLLSALDPHCASKTLVYTMHEDLKNIERAFAAGAAAYVSKRESAETFILAVRKAASGEKYMSPRIARVTAEKLGRAVSPQEPASVKQTLSPQELKVYEALGIGCSTDDIAELMHISPKTVESYYSRILLKLNIPGMHTLRRRAIADCNHL